MLRRCCSSDRLGVVTRTLFSQRDFTDTSILDDFYSSLESSLRGQLTESGLYMGAFLQVLKYGCILDPE